MLFNFNRQTLSTFCVEFLISDKVKFDLFQPQTFAFVICVHISTEHLPLSSKPNQIQSTPNGTRKAKTVSSMTRPPTPRRLWSSDRFRPTWRSPSGRTGTRRKTNVFSVCVKRLRRKSWRTKTVKLYWA